MNSEPRKKGTALGKVDVKKRAVRIQELSDKVGAAIKLYEAAQKKFEAGQDSLGEWQNIIKVLSVQIKDMQHFQAVAHHNIGIIHAGRGELRKAEERFKKAIEIDPDYAMAYYNLAVVYKKMKNLELAKKFYFKAKQLGYPPGK